MHVRPPRPIQTGRAPILARLAPADKSAVATALYGAVTCARLLAVSAPTSTLALGTAPPLRVTCPMMLGAARAAARTAVATVFNRLATNLCVVGTRRHVCRIERASAYGDSCDDVAIQNLSTQRRCLFVRFMRCSRAKLSRALHAASSTNTICLVLNVAAMDFQQVLWSLRETCRGTSPLDHERLGYQTPTKPASVRGCVGLRWGPNEAQRRRKSLARWPNGCLVRESLGFLVKADDGD